ncbi:uncharacterized protein A1O9_08558 [Exophiala aquamarina CBS 119918]|uniref:Amidoligase enzyme n=1 Tax=Exophiala aquamarina CBS 119918 TaxID=1182545 RepID=A0A072P7X9_9EURO|nr:uncharacterized protein A1O9_08558 [Exophiala aquamarina CBS 119918]KEF55807.1 hypothetical protein A1O9_08558 [Exophiala aquamarina CBS 119918]
MSSPCSSSSPRARVSRRAGVRSDTPTGAPPPRPRRRRRHDNITDPSSSSSLPVAPPTSTAIPRDYLPFCFGAEFELILRPKSIAYPDFDAPTRVTRDFNLRLLDSIAQILSSARLPCGVYHQGSDDKSDYTIWNATLDSSVSKKHIRDGFYPVEIVPTINKFWAALNTQFEFRKDASCGFHVHISMSTGSYSDVQLRAMAKAVTFWEPATARCAPPSRQDDIQGFCKSNIVNTSAAKPLARYGPLRGLVYAFDYIDHSSRESIIEYVCPDKHRAWNLNPCRPGGHGSIEFRRAPGVSTSQASIHWIAFTMAFLDMAIQHSPESMASHVRESAFVPEVYFPDFRTQLLECAAQLRIDSCIDLDTGQFEDPEALHFTMSSEKVIQKLQRADHRYHLSDNC